MEWTRRIWKMCFDRCRKMARDRADWADTIMGGDLSRGHWATQKGKGLTRAHWGGACRARTGLHVPRHARSSEERRARGRYGTVLGTLAASAGAFACPDRPFSGEAQGARTVNRRDFTAGWQRHASTVHSECLVTRVEARARSPPNEIIPRQQSTTPSSAPNSPPAFCQPPPSPSTRRPDRPARILLGRPPRHAVNPPRPRASHCRVAPSRLWTFHNAVTATVTTGLAAARRSWLRRLSMTMTRTTPSRSLVTTPQTSRSSSCSSSPLSSPSSSDVTFSAPVDLTTSYYISCRLYPTSPITNPPTPHRATLSVPTCMNTVVASRQNVHTSAPLHPGFIFTQL